MNPAYLYGQKLAEDTQPPATPAPPPAPYGGALPEGVSPVDDETLRWKTPGGHTVSMPYRPETIQRHLATHGPEGARALLHNAIQGESSSTDRRISQEQASFFNQHPRVRDGMVGTTLGAMGGFGVGALAGRPGLGALAGSALGLGLSQLGTPHQRKGPEEVDYSGRDPRHLPKELYHLSALERRQLERQDEMQEDLDRAHRRLRHQDIYGRHDPYGYDPYGYGYGYGY